MKVLTIFKHIRDPRNADRILRTETLRILKVDQSFEGIGAKGEINHAEFKKLAEDLEPTHTTITVS